MTDALEENSRCALRVVSDQLGEATLLARTMTYGEQVFLFGNPTGFPKEAKNQIEDMVLNKLFYFDDEATTIAQYEAFMKLAEPYWMSCVTKNEDAPILDPDHYLTYLDDQHA